MLLVPQRFLQESSMRIGGPHHVSLGGSPLNTFLVRTCSAERICSPWVDQQYRVEFLGLVQDVCASDDADVE